MRDPSSCREDAAPSCPNHPRPLYAEATHGRVGWLPTGPTAWPAGVASGSCAHADRPRFIDLCLVRGLRIVPETGGAGTRAAASRRDGKPCSGRGRRTCQIRMQRRHDFIFANRLPGQHGARTAAPVAANRAGADQFGHHRPIADVPGAVKMSCTNCRTALQADAAGGRPSAARWPSLPGANKPIDNRPVKATVAGTASEL
jgi:hypothetical protein